MRRKNLGNGLVKRSIMLAMAFMMGFTAIPATAFADELEKQPTEGVDDTTVDSTPATQITAPNAQTVLGTANSEANQAAAQASPVISIGEGVLSQETLNTLSDIQASELNAAAAENRATDDMDAADKILSDAAQDTAKSVDTIETELDKVDATETAGNTAATEAKNQASAAGAAKDAAVSATTSSDAKTQADAATDAASAADTAATEVENQASAAKDAYDKAAAEYNAAVEAANKALEDAQAAKDAGLAEADQAVADAQAALDKATALQKEMEAKRAAAEEELNVAEGELESAQTKIDKAKQELLSASAEELDAVKNAADTGAALVKADALLAAAQLAYDASDLNVTLKENAIENLKQKKEAAEAELDALETELEELQDNIDTNQDEYDSKKAEYETLKTAVDAADAALAQASADLETAKKESEEKTKAYNEIAEKVSAEGSYEKTVYDYEQIINDTTKTDEERTAAKNSLIVAVMSRELGIDGERKSFGESVDGYYTVISLDENGDEKTQYYKTQITENGTIEVWEYSCTGTEYTAVENSEKTYTSQEAYNEAVVGKTEGKDYQVEHTDAVAAIEAEYTVTYTVHKVGDINDTYTNNYKNISTKNGTNTESLTNATKNNTELQSMYVYAKTRGGSTYRYDWDGKNWMQTKIVVSDGDGNYKEQDLAWYDISVSITSWSLGRTIIGIYYKNDVNETVNEVKESELSQYSSKSSYTFKQTKEATAAIPESWKVTLLQQVNSYALTDDTIDGTQSSLYNEYNDKKQAKEEADATLTAAQTTIDHIISGYTDQDGQEHKSLQTLKDEEYTAQQNYYVAENNLTYAQETYDKANAEYHAKKLKYDEYYAREKVWFIEVPGTSQYDKDMAEAEKELTEAKIARGLAEIALKKAKEDQAAAKQNHSDAIKALNATSKEFASTLVDAIKAFVELSDKKADVLAAKAKLELAESKEDYANKLEQECSEALAAAKAAQEAVDNYDVSIEGKDKLDELKDELEKAKSKYEDLQAKADAARELADQAAEDAKTALNRVATLLAEEAARRNTSTITTTSSNTTVYYATPSIDTEVLAQTILEIEDDATPLAGATTTTGRRARTVAAADGDTATIEDEETPLAGDSSDETVDSDSVAFIADEETPLAGPEKSANWWWLLLVAIAGVAGGTYYYNKKKKANTIETK